MSYLSHADLGGEEGHGSIVPEAEGNPFHSTWEPRTLALTVAMGASGKWNIDLSRATRETLSDYRRLSYYQIWLGALEKLCIATGLASKSEIETGRSEGPGIAVARVLHTEDVVPVLALGAPTARPAHSIPLFAIGQRVRTRGTAVSHHTRLPGYARGKIGTIERVAGHHVFPDSNAQGLGERPTWLYTVVFEGKELWGDAARKGTVKVSIDAWQDYLAAA